MNACTHLAVPHSNSFCYPLIDWNQECSGLADPGALAGMFWQDEALEAPVALDAIVALVDAKHFPLHARSENAHAVRIIAFGVCIVC